MSKPKITRSPYLPVTQGSVTVTLTDEAWMLVQQAAEAEAPFLNAAENRRLLRTAARRIHKARLAARGGKQS